MPKFATWSAPGQAFRIEYSSAVLDEIRMAAVEGYYRLPHGGVETGGVLFGTREPNGVRVEAWRPIACEYAKGPSFLLSGKDEAALAETLRSWGGHPDLARMEPVGWYRAHTRSEILLSAADVSFFDRFFPQPWQIGLIVRPASVAPTRAGFFFREPDGGMRTESSYHEFVLAPLPAASLLPKPSPPVDSVAETPPVQPTPEPPRVEARIEPAPPPEPVPMPEVEHQPTTAVVPELAMLENATGRGARWKWYAAGLIVVAAAVVGFWLLKPSSKGVSLTATDAGNQLKIAWDSSAVPLSHAIGGSIEIDDRGMRTQVKLTPSDLRSGSLYYARQSSDVVVRMTVDRPGSPPFAEMTHFLKPGQTAAPAAPRVESANQTGPPKTEEKRPNPAKTPSPIAATPPKTEEKRFDQAKTAPSTTAALPKTEEKRSDEAKTPSQMVAAPPAAAEPAVSMQAVVPFRAPEPTPRPAAEIPAAAPPTIRSQPPQTVPLASANGPAPPPPAVPVAPAKPAPVASGRIVWTGKLPKNGRLVIEGNRASLGNVSGALPARPLGVSAYPGDLTAQGITLFTADPRYSKPLTEAAAANNGWNPTTYTLDAKRAGAIKVLQLPTAQNGYKLVLQNGTNKLSVLLIEWRAAP